MGAEDKMEDVKEEPKVEEAKEEKNEGAEMKEESDDEPEEEPPKAELTEEEKKFIFRQQEVKDLLMPVLNASFAEFSLPTKDEGFTEIQYEWEKEKDAKAYFRTWMLEKKRTTRIENLTP